MVRCLVHVFFLLFNKGPLGREVWNPGNSNSFTQDLQRLDIPDVWTTGIKRFLTSRWRKNLIHPRSLSVRPWNFRWKGRRSFPFGARQFFRGELLNFQRISPRLACKGNGSFDWPFRFKMNNIEKILWRWTIKPTAWKWQVFLLRNAHAPQKKCPKFQFKQTSNFIINVSGCFLNTSSLQSLWGEHFDKAKPFRWKTCHCRLSGKKSSLHVAVFEEVLVVAALVAGVLVHPKSRGRFVTLDLGKSQKLRNLWCFQVFAFFHFSFLWRVCHFASFAKLQVQTVLLRPGVPHSYSDVTEIEWLLIEKDTSSEWSYVQPRVVVLMIDSSFSLSKRFFLNHKFLISF